MSKGTQRRLAAIVSADVVGYSRLMSFDEEGTLARLRQLREAIIDPRIAAHEGRTVKLMGDGMLLEFGSVVEAVLCCIEIQRQVAAANAGLAEDQIIEFRVGINLGDIIIEGDDIHGDGVNVTARLEALAEPGGILISRAARDQIRNQHNIVLDDMGEVEVKNIARPIRIFRVVLDPDAEGAAPIAPAGKSRRRLLLVAATVVAVTAIGAVAAWWLYSRPASEVTAAASKTTLPLPDKPSIAVLPFTNMSGGAEQEYFADGMAEDLITDLSKISGLFVIARNSSFVYKGQQVDIRRVAAELGVRYVLEGSVRRVGNQVRINAQLIDATTGGHLWAERYDGTLDDVFELQDKVTAKIIAALSIQLTSSEVAVGADRDTENPQAHDAFLRGWSHYLRSSPEHFAQAVPHFERAVALDPEYGRALAALASIHLTASDRFWNAALDLTPDDALEKGLTYLRAALRYPTPLAHQVMSAYATEQGDYDRALEEAERAMVLNPNDPDGISAKGRALVFAGRAAEGGTLFERAMRLNPSYPVDYLFYLGLGEYLQGRNGDAISTLEQAQGLAPDHPGVLTFLVAAYGQSSQAGKAAPLIERLRVLAKTTTFYYSLATTNVTEAELWTLKEARDLDRLRDGLRKAGLPEFPDEWNLRRTDRLSGAEIEALSFGRTHTGRHTRSGLEFKISRDAAGRFTATGLWNDTGTSRVVGNRLCNKWSKYSDSCAVIYRNPEGSIETGDDYVLVQHSGAFYFTVSE